MKIYKASQQAKEKQEAKQARKQRKRKRLGDDGEEVKIESFNNLENGLYEYKGMKSYKKESAEDFKARIERLKSKSNLSSSKKSSNTNTNKFCKL